MHTESELRRRFTHHAPNDNQVQLCTSIRARHLQLAQFITRNTPAGVEQDRAIEALELSMMQANAAIARNGYSDPIYPRPSVDQLGQIDYGIEFELPEEIKIAGALVVGEVIGIAPDQDEDGEVSSSMAVVVVVGSENDVPIVRTATVEERAHYFDSLNGAADPDNYDPEDEQESSQSDASGSDDTEDAEAPQTPEMKLTGSET